MPSAPKAPPRTKAKPKSAPTIALNPKEFENLKVQRDASKLKLTERDSEAKDLNERLEILGTRCRLFEQQRNNQLYEDISPLTPPVSTPSSIPVTSSPASPPPSVTSPPATVAPTAPHYAPSASLTAVDSLLNLEVLKAVRSSYSSPNSISIEESFKELENRIDAFKIEIKTSLSILTQEVMSLSSKPRAQCPPPLTGPPSQSRSQQTEQVSPSSASVGTQCSPLASSSSTQTVFSLLTPENPPQAKPSCRALPKTRPSLLGPPPTTTSQRRSLLGPPPRARRTPGHPAPLSTYFLQEHREQKQKQVNHARKPRTRPSKRPSVPLPTVSAAPTVAILVDVPLNLPTQETLGVISGRNRNPLDESLCDIDATVDAFGDERSDELDGSNQPSSTAPVPSGSAGISPAPEAPSYSAQSSSIHESSSLNWIVPTCQTKSLMQSLTLSA